MRPRASTTEPASSTGSQRSIVTAAGRRRDAATSRSLTIVPSRSDSDAITPSSWFWISGLSSMSVRRIVCAEP
jgi:hypothetical protein